MRSFKEQSLSERLERQSQARRAALEKFKARPAEDTPEMIKLREQQKAVAEARAVRDAAKAEIKRKEAEERAAREISRRRRASGWPSARRSRR